MAHDYRSISVRDETFETLREAKPEGVTWDYWLREQITIEPIDPEGTADALERQGKSFGRGGQ